MRNCPQKDALGGVPNIAPGYVKGGLPRVCRELESSQTTARQLLKVP